MKGKIDIIEFVVKGTRDELFNIHYFEGYGLSFFTALSGTKIVTAKWIGMDQRIREIMNPEIRMETREEYMQTAYRASTALLTSYFTKKTIIYAVQTATSEFTIIVMIPENSIGEAYSFYDGNQWYGMKPTDTLRKYMNEKGIPMKIEHIPKKE